jgi:hypothetical protein
MTAAITQTNRKIQATYSLCGEALIPSDTNKTDEAKRRTPFARVIRSYFKDGINKLPSKEGFGFGVGPGTAILELFGAGALAWKSFSAATAVNLLTSGAELFETIIGGTNILEDKDEAKARIELEAEKNSIIKDPDKQEELELKLEELKNREGKNAWTRAEKGSEQKAEMYISGVQLSAGIAGGIQTLFSLGSKISGNEKEESEIPLFDKIWLSAASLVNAGLMLFASGEKTLISTLIENRGLEQDGKKLQPVFGHGNSIRLNAESDFRCFLEWTGMAFFTWFKNLSFKNFSVKDAFDIGISTKAILKGSEYFRKFGKEEKVESGKNLMGNVFGWDFGKQLYLGTESKPGIREKYIAPFLELTGSKPPKVYIRGGEVVCEVESENINARTENESRSPISEPQTDSTNLSGQAQSEADSRPTRKVSSR